MQDDETRHRDWSLWAAINVAQALTDAGLVASADRDKAVTVAKDQIFDLLTGPERWAKAFPGKPAG